MHKMHVWKLRSGSKDVVRSSDMGLESGFKGLMYNDLVSNLEIEVLPSRL